MGSIPVVHTDASLEAKEKSLCRAQPLKAIQSTCKCCQWDYTAFIHPSHPSFTLPFPPASLSSLTHSSYLLIFPQLQHLHMSNDNLCWPLAPIREHFISLATSGRLVHSSSAPSSVFYSTDSSLLRKRHQREPT